MTGSTMRWHYPRAQVLAVPDGDNLVLLIDRGLGDHQWVSCRLHGMAARELRDPGGPEAAAYLAELAPVGSTVAVTSLRWDKYGGRILGTVTLADGRDVATTMIRAGYAAPWDGRGAQPKPAWPIEAAGGTPVRAAEAAPDEVADLRAALARRERELKAALTEVERLRAVAAGVRKLCQHEGNWLLAADVRRALDGGGAP